MNTKSSINYPVKSPPASLSPSVGDLLMFDNGFAKHLLLVCILTNSATETWEPSAGSLNLRNANQDYFSAVILNSIHSDSFFIGRVYLWDKNDPYIRKFEGSVTLETVDKDDV